MAEGPDLSNIPIPDPSAITTDRINSTKVELRSEIRRDIDALRTLLETRLNAMDQAATLLAANVSRVPTDTDKQISHLKELHDERFAAVQLQFTERDVRSHASQAAAEVALHAALQGHDERFLSITKQLEERDVRARASEDAAKVAVNAALQAQKEAAAAQSESNDKAIAKSEAATAKQIDGLQALMKGTQDATNAMIADIKSRLDKGEGVSRGSADTRTDRRADIGSYIGIAGFVLSVAAIIVTITITTMSRPAAPSPTIIATPAVVPVAPGR